MMRSVYHKPMAISALWRNAWQLFCRRWVQLLSATLITTGLILGTVGLLLLSISSGAQPGSFFYVC